MRSSATICCLLLAVRACSGIFQVSAITGWCEGTPREINLGGQTIERTTAASARECCGKCAARLGCKGSNWCSRDGCDGGAPRGTCDLKTWGDGGPAAAWGCAGAPGQQWRSSVAYGIQGFNGDVLVCPGSSLSGSVVVVPAPPPQQEDGDNVPNCPGCIKRNWRGQVVILSIDSGKMGEGGNHGSPYIRSPEQCAKECAGKTKGGLTANAFTFCNDKSGCGSGCLQFEYYKGSAGCAPPNSGENCFGPFATYGDGDLGGSVQPGCIADRFRYATCSCKFVGELNEGKLPELVDGDSSWISGRAPLPEIQPRGL